MDIYRTGLIPSTQIGPQCIGPQCKQLTRENYKLIGGVIPYVRTERQMTECLSMLNYFQKYQNIMLLSHKRTFSNHKYSDKNNQSLSITNDKGKIELNTKLFDPKCMELLDNCKGAFNIHKEILARKFTPYQARMYLELPYRNIQAVNATSDHRGILMSIAQSTELANKIFQLLFHFTNMKEGSVQKVLIDFDARNLGGTIFGFWNFESIASQTDRYPFFKTGDIDNYAMTNFTNEIFNNHEMQEIYDAIDDIASEAKIPDVILKHLGDVKLEFNIDAIKDSKLKANDNDINKYIIGDDISESLQSIIVQQPRKRKIKKKEKKKKKSKPKKDKDFDPEAYMMQQ